MSTARNVPKRHAGAGIQPLSGESRRRMYDQVSRCSRAIQSEMASLRRAKTIENELRRADRPKSAKSLARCIRQGLAKDSYEQPFECLRKECSVACPLGILETQLVIADWLQADPRTRRPGALWVTVACPKWQRPLGGLQRFSIRKAKAELYAVLKSAPTEVMAFGRFEVVLHRSRSAQAAWRPHFHFIAWSEDVDGLKRHLKRSFKKHGQRVVVVTPVTEFASLTAYLNKGISGLKEEYEAPGGGVGTKGKRLSEWPDAEFEVYEFLRKRPLRDLVVSIRIRLPLRLFHAS
jgi:hypothetical protein